MPIVQKKATTRAMTSEATFMAMLVLYGRGHSGCLSCRRIAEMDEMA